MLLRNYATIWRLFQSCKATNYQNEYQQILGEKSPQIFFKKQLVIFQSISAMLEKFFPIFKQEMKQPSAKDQKALSIFPKKHLRLFLLMERFV
jgi:hypothetical protein